MLPYRHFIVSLIIVFILIILNFQWWQVALFFITAFFIDVDHYIYFICKKGSWNLKKAYHYFYNLNKQLKKRKKKLELLMIFHNIETLILLIVLSFFLFNVFFPILLGIIIHYILDIVTMLTCKEKKYKRALSLIYYIIKNA